MSNQNSPSTDQRLTDLEIKATFTEDLLDQLDAVVVRQQRQIDLLMTELAQHRELQKNAATVMQDTGASSLRSDLPPHF